MHFRTFYKSYFRLFLPLILGLSTCTAVAGDLPAIKKAGVLRHLGVPYANFVTGAGDGLDVELMQGFARHLGVRYEFVGTNWSRVIGDLTGRHAKRGADNHAQSLKSTTVRGDVIANGMTMLDWRKEIVEFSMPSFPTGVWLMARADSILAPIQPSGALGTDIGQVKQALDGRSVLALENTCLDPGLYQIAETGADIRLLGNNRTLNEMAPAILNHMAETTLLDVPDALIALDKWPGELKVIGPISGKQLMAPAFRKDSPLLKAAYGAYFEKILADGSYLDLVTRYYPSVLLYFPDFFRIQ